MTCKVNLLLCRPCCAYRDQTAEAKVTLFSHSAIRMIKLTMDVVLSIDLPYSNSNEKIL